MPQSVSRFGTEPCSVTHFSQRRVKAGKKCNVAVENAWPQERKVKQIMKAWLERCVQSKGTYVE